ncbi:acyl carrier protein [Nonomuraea phyllanthi]|uniref:Acyl carrier protein n=1 Tax=Nonomuraea phyllanthi TaxID=2219224 RepID=A0A5C4W200_9ACTN|nr:phosphopantetheine-binding protein [Nonomuraea phyllanthi]KAB8191651.1 acyl carrier protein [Nonomuraea phyllanthi]QFY13023.1 acyl carrier protein [Nonomuraea phyllanthi]
MTGGRTTDEIAYALVAFIQENLVPDDVDLEVDRTTPLLLSGLLDSLRTARLLNFIRRELGVPVPAAKLDPENFKDVTTVVAMLEELESARSV